MLQYTHIGCCNVQTLINDYKYKHFLAERSRIRDIVAAPNTYIMHSLIPSSKQEHLKHEKTDSNGKKEALIIRRQ